MPRLSNVSAVMTVVGCRRSVSGRAILEPVTTTSLRASSFFRGVSVVVTGTEGVSASARSIPPTGTRNNTIAASDRRGDPSRYIRILQLPCVVCRRLGSARQTYACLPRKYHTIVVAMQSLFGSRLTLIQALLVILRLYDVLNRRCHVNKYIRLRPWSWDPRRRERVPQERRCSVECRRCCNFRTQ